MADDSFGDDDFGDDGRVNRDDDFDDSFGDSGFEQGGDANEAAGATPWVEGSWMNKIHGKYYLQYAVPGTQYKSYSDGLYIGDSPKGPFTFAKYSPFSHKPTGYAAGAGHSSSYLQPSRPGQCGRGSFTNGTRPGKDYASLRMRRPRDTAADCEALCCGDPRCATWVYVPDGLYPNRPAGTFCWLKASAIALKGTTCDNGKPGCVSGVVVRSDY